MGVFRAMLDARPVSTGWQRLHRRPSPSEAFTVLDVESIGHGLYQERRRQRKKCYTLTERWSPPSLETLRRSVFLDEHNMHGLCPSPSCHQLMIVILFHRQPLPFSSPTGIQSWRETFSRWSGPLTHPFQGPAWSPEPGTVLDTAADRPIYWNPLHATLKKKARGRRLIKRLQHGPPARSVVKGANEDGAGRVGGTGHGARGVCWTSS